MSRSIRVRATPRSVSGLFAAPATTRQSIERASASSISPPAGAGREHVELGRRGSPRRRAPPRCRAARPTCRTAAGVEVAADHLGARLRQLPGERGADLAEPDHADAPPVEVARPGGGGEPAPHRLEDRLGRDGGGVAAAAVRQRAADHEAREAGHVVHVRRRRADVLGGDVGAVEAVDHARGRLEPGLAHVREAVVDHHGLAAAEVEAGGRGLQRHRAREAHHVVERLAQAARVALQAHSAERRAQHGRMHRDDEPQPRLLVLADDDLLVVVVSQRDVQAAEHAGWQWSSSLTLYPVGRIIRPKAKLRSVYHQW